MRKRIGPPFHDRVQCDPGPCVYHSPSDHRMNTWPTNFRADPFAFGLVERLCPHGVGHPDPDSVRWMSEVTGQDSWGIHGCDLCCVGAHDA